MVLKILKKKKNPQMRNTIRANFAGEMKFIPVILTLENLLPGTAVLLKKFLPKSL